ncbi:hypothetical protein [Algivirga pacifica]|uniref:hypothetical protein n=1 Tax=Algivirga pacifica TaxID=1162670 RepID=UPI0031EC631A
MKDSKRYFFNYNKGLPFFILKTVLFVGAVGYIFWHLQNKTALHKGFWETLSIGYHHHQLPFLLLAILLIPVNWGLEAKRWQTLVFPFYPLSYKHAVTGVLSGVAASFFTGKLLGLTGGRLLHIPKGHKTKALIPLGISHFLLTLVTAIACMLGYGFLYGIPTSTYYLFPLLIVGMSCSFYLFKKYQGWLFEKKPHWKVQWEVYTRIPKRIVMKAWWISIFRYLVFLMQFYLVLLFFSVNIDFLHTIALITMIFGIKTFVPTFSAIGDLGIREASSLYLFQQYGIEEIGVIYASLSLWLLNILFPTLVGLLLNHSLLKPKHE